MSSFAQIQEAMNNLGPLVEDIELIEQLGEDRWAIVFDEDTVLEAAASRAANKLTFSIAVAQVREENCQEMYRTLLGYNFMWPETGGIRMALGPEDEVYLLFDLFLDELEAATLATVVANLVDAAGTWRIAIQNANEEAIGSTPAVSQASGMRV